MTLDVDRHQHRGLVLTCQADEGRERTYLDRGWNDSDPTPSPALEPPLEALVDTFATGAQWAVREALRHDWWRRVEDAVRASPGLFTLVACRITLPASVAVRLVRGDRLRDVTRSVLATLELSHPQAPSLIRGAPVLVPPSHLLAVLRAPTVTIDDRPRCDEDALVWYAWCATASLEVPELLDFAGRHALVLEAHAQERGMCPSAVLHEIAHCIQANRATWPSRTAPPARVFAEVEAWHEWPWGPPLDPEVAFSTPPIGGREITGIDATPILTVGALHDEGRRMHHCVAHLAELGVAGVAHFFHAVVVDQPVTIHVSRSGPNRYQLVEASGLANIAPEHPELIQRWVAGLRDPRAQNTG